MCEICSKLTIKTSERPQRRHCPGVAIADFEQVNAGWDTVFSCNLQLT